MADPVSSVAYAIEATLRQLDGDPKSLFATMALVVVITIVVSATYHQLIGRFPSGGGGPEASRPHSERDGRSCLEAAGLSE